MYKIFNSKFYERSIKIVSSKAGEKLLLLWSFFEASFWFIAPDFLLVIFGVLQPKDKNKFFIKAFIASFLGGAMYYLLNIISFNTMNTILQQTPFVTERMFIFIRDVYMNHGLTGVLFQSFSFMSFKIWTHLAVESNLNPFGYFSLVMISRSLRLYLVIFLSSLVGKFFPDFIRKHFILVFISYTLIFISMLTILE